MILFDGSFYQVSQGFFSGWKVHSKLNGTIAVPNRLQKERIGLVWMQVRQTKRGQSIDPQMSEDVMFGSFAQAVLDPSCDDGILWDQTSPDALAQGFIAKANELTRQAVEAFPRMYPNTRQ